MFGYIMSFVIFWFNYVIRYILVKLKLIISLARSVILLHLSHFGYSVAYHVCELCFKRISSRS